ncbi:MAG: phosphoribosylglycinamide formyltransferase [Clostridiales bacterium]|jgi:phosphoribosylglycinamide formyltransferase-1|nr:phosphoribosylglycinamide formyltransferase [Clostridiales bacterium]
MEKARIAVLVSGGGTNLQALLDAERRGELKSGEITLVISNKADAYALTRAENAGVRTAIVTKAEYPTQEAFEGRIIELIEENRTDLIILAGFMCILSADFTSRYPERIINVHPSLIPSFCGKGYYGLKVHEAALAYGVKVTGATVHYVNEVPDGGRIIMQRAVEVKEGDTPEILQRRVMEEAEWVILPAAAELVCSELIRKKHKGEMI